MPLAREQPNMTDVSESSTSEYAHLKVLTISNHKGGVAKTTLSKLLTEYSVRNGIRVLGIDIDPQCNFSARFVPMEADGGAPPQHPTFDPNDPTWDELSYAPPGYWSIAEFFRLGYVEPYPTDNPRLHFIPSHKKELTGFLEQVERHSIEEAVVEHIRAMLVMEFYQEEFDLVIIDTPPQTSALTASAARAATHLLIPTEMQEDSVAGMADMAQLWMAENQARQGEKLHLVGILATKYDNQSAAQRRTLEQLAQNPVLGDKLIQPPMRYLQTYANSSSTYANPRSLFDMHEKTPARIEAEAFCEVIYERIFA
jgi:chromosome partitioning protein